MLIDLLCHVSTNAWPPHEYKWHNGGDGEGKKHFKDVVTCNLGMI
jgi:hypothetical protein